jgi:hypothetical protein
VDSTSQGIEEKNNLAVTSKVYRQIKHIRRKLIEKEISSNIYRVTLKLKRGADTYILLKSRKFTLIKKLHRQKAAEE